MEHGTDYVLTKKVQRVVMGGIPEQGMLLGTERFLFFLPTMSRPLELLDQIFQDSSIPSQGALEENLQRFLFAPDLTPQGLEKSITALVNQLSGLVYFISTFKKFKIEAEGWFKKGLYFKEAGRRTWTAFNVKSREDLRTFKAFYRSQLNP